MSYVNFLFDVLVFLTLYVPKFSYLLQCMLLPGTNDFEYTKKGVVLHEFYEFY